MKVRLSLVGVLLATFIVFSGSPVFAQSNTDAVATSVGAAVVNTDDVPQLSYTQTLRRGVKSEQVRALQNILKELGFYDRSLDGDYGSGTYAAVLAFQRARGLAADGVAGPKTFAAIMASANGTSFTLPPILDDNCTDQDVYEPVCGQQTINCLVAPCDESGPRTFANTCSLEAAGATYLYDGACSNTRPTEEGLSDEAIKALIKQLNAQVDRLENYIKELKEKIAELEEQLG
ncbi:peptidoglycan-binding protein [Patescibacteria group bacterium]|nr:peptidoglycan-binding protein [Patescibacteria group bacterium]